MLLWRLSGKRHAAAFDGGYGLRFDGRWNVAGHPITYCATSPALCVLEKLVHIEDPALMPDLVMVTYEAPDAIGAASVELDELPATGDARKARRSSEATPGVDRCRRRSCGSPRRSSRCDARPT